MRAVLLIVLTTLVACGGHGPTRPDWDGEKHPETVPSKTTSARQRECDKQVGSTQSRAANIPIYRCD